MGDSFGGESLFDISVKDIKEIMDCRGLEGVAKIKEYGGAQEICEKLQTNAVSGLSGQRVDIDLRKMIFGRNVIPPKPPKKFYQLMWDAAQDTVLIILMGCAVLTIVITIVMAFTNDEESQDLVGWVEALGIVFTILVSILATSTLDYHKQKQFRGLQKRIEAEQTCSVIRGWSLMEIPTKDLVVGDVCEIHYGDLIPADGIVIQSNDLLVDESTLTGESVHVKKGEDVDPLLLSGTHVMEGSGRMLVLAVGPHSQTGIIFTLLGDDEEDDGERSILQLKLATLAIQIGQAGLAIAVLTVVILLVQNSIESFLIRGEHVGWRHLMLFVHSLIVGITVIVVAVPEGLPLAVTISLAYSVIKMMDDNNLVRHINACETMGGATVFCSDKTGTLTTNKMAVMENYICGLLRKQPPKFEDIPETVREKILVTICVNSSYTSSLVRTYVKGEPIKHVGNRTECALLTFVDALGEDYEKVRSAYPQEKLVKVFTFNSARKSMTTVIRINNGFRLMTKGAAELVLRKCSYMYDKDGNVQKLTDKIKKKIVSGVIEPLTKNSLRTLTLAYRDFVESAGEINDVLLKRTPNWDNEGEVVSNMTLLAIAGIEDPVRPEVPEAIRQCHEAGITTIMVTGDNVHTARSVALKCGIIREGDGNLVLEGRDFNRMTRGPDGEFQQALFDDVWPRLRVLARSSPADKHALVQGIIQSRVTKHREVVAVTGDGTNDAPALKRADVGFAMGLTATEVAKQASDIILLDDNFMSMVKAVMWGRNVYDNISRFMQFQLTVNVVAVLLAFAGACAVRDSPLGAVQMLWVNLIMDTLASLCLATDAPSPALLRRRPYGRTRSLLSPEMLRAIAGHAAYQLAVTFALLFYGERFLDVEEARGRGAGAGPSAHYTIIFNTFVMMTLFNELTCRKIHRERNVFAGLHTNPVFMFIWAASFAVQILIVHFGRGMFRTVPLTVDEWCWCVFFGVGVLVWHQLVISVPMRSAPHVPYWRLESLDAEAMHLAYEWYPEHALSRAPKHPKLQVFRLRRATRVREQSRLPDFRRSASAPARRSVFDVRRRSSDAADDDDAGAKR